MAKTDRLIKRYEKVTKKEREKKKKFVLKKKSKAHKKLDGVKTMKEVQERNLKDLERVMDATKSGTFYEGDTSKKLSIAHQRQQTTADIEKSTEYDKKFQKRFGSILRRKKAKRIRKKLER